MQLITPKDAVEQLHLSRGAISRCVALGAPVHRWGPRGWRYMIDPDEFIAWMNEHGEQAQAKGTIVTPFRAGTSPRLDQLAEVL